MAIHPSGFSILEAETELGYTFSLLEGRGLILFVESISVMVEENGVSASLSLQEIVVDISKGCLGCFTKPRAMDEASKGLRTESHEVKKDNRSEDYWFSSTSEIGRYDPAESHQLAYQAILLILKVVLAFRLILLNLVLQILHLLGNHAGHISALLSVKYLDIIMKFSSLTP
ncbi:hypothetical protein RIF29_21754 [Crotalaria pallida]|uniref:Uncharacterized protein n=1 Tax=Crotalaria pallida TaxID=3830 RepID=A0AAN9F3M9_CROPI